MKHTLLFPALMLSTALCMAQPKAAPAPKTHYLDHSTQSLIDAESAKKVMAENVPAKAWKVYPASKYAFVSQVEGGMTQAGHCVITARVMLLPRTPTMKAVLFRPQYTATAFDSLSGASGDACKALARTKLKEATLAVVSNLVNR